MGLPKSGEGRLIPILNPIRPVLEALVDGLQPEEFLFVGERGRALWQSNYRQKVRWTAVAAECGFPGLRFHDLRHSAASWLAGSGVPITVVQSILGHADVRVTQRYLHTNERLLDEVIQITNTERS